MALIYAPFAQAQAVTAEEARAIAKEATIYGFAAEAGKLLDRPGYGPTDE